MIRIIQTAADLEEGAACLSRQDPRLAYALQLTGELPLRRRKDGFESLLDAIVSQQVSVAAGNAIWSRLKAAKLTGPRKIAAASDDELRQCGLSRQKIRYARELAAARINFRQLRTQNCEEVVATLTVVPGIGRWTAEIYAMFSLGHADAFAAGDLALQEATRLLFGMKNRPTEAELRHLAEAWRPWRAVAARILWKYYHLEKQRSGIR
ncbi:MAG: DNA-3-methyladenine glycosylase 2 family protein [Verrucomicrobiota bacterium]